MHRILRITSILLLGLGIGCPDPEVVETVDPTFDTFDLDALFDVCNDPVPEASADGVEIDSTCVFDLGPGTFQPSLEWRMSAFDQFATSRHSVSVPVVGQLTDDNQDSQVNSYDVPDIVIATFGDDLAFEGVLRAISGDGTVVHWSVNQVVWQGAAYFPYRYGHAAIGDIDNDQQPDVVTTFYDGDRRTCVVGAIDRQGSPKWMYTDFELGCRSHAPALADLEGDGSVEVIVGQLIINGEDGTLQGRGTKGRGYYDGYINGGSHSVPADLNGDGSQEVVAGSTVYRANGAERCNTGYDDGYTAIADMNGDGLGDFVVTGNGWVRTFDANCQLLREWEVYGGGYGGPATIADLDGDGDPEIGLAGEFFYSVYEANGALRWSSPSVDASSQSTGSAVFDFEGDGQAEIVYADERALYILDGATGTELMADTTHSSGTINELPTIVDIDADGNAEIVMVNQDVDGTGSTGLYVIGDANDSWMPTRRVWNQSSYHITNISDDLEVPLVPEPNWPDRNNFRSAEQFTLGQGFNADAIVQIVGTCNDFCASGVQKILVRIANRGTASLPANLSVGILAPQTNGQVRLIDVLKTSTAIAPGAVTAGLSFSIDLEDMPLRELRVIVDQEQTLPECDETNNQAIIVDDLCP
jgi:hypothetical protein